MSERFADTIVSLPMHPHLRSADLVSVTRAVHEALDNRNSALLAGGHRLGDSVAPPLANGD